MGKKITPSANMHFKDINSGDIYEGSIYLGIYDKKSNYVEVTEEEYQAYLAKQQEEVIEDGNN